MAMGVTVRNFGCAHCRGFPFWSVLFDGKLRRKLTITKLLLASFLLSAKMLIFAISPLYPLTLVFDSLGH